MAFTRVAASFSDVWCPHGFTCVSKIDDFGLHHDGDWTSSRELASPAEEILDEAYEVGCPARGKMTSDGRCMDDGEGGTNLCFSPQRFEVSPDAPCGGPDDGRCRCVRMPPKNGTNIVKDGIEVFNSEFEESLATNSCDHCASLSLNEEACNGCWPSCVHGLVPIDSKGTVRPKCMDTKELWEKAPALADDLQGDGPPIAQIKEGGRPYNDGQSVRMSTMRVVPHYDYWDPAVYQDRTREPTGAVNEQGATADDMSQARAPREPNWPYQTRSQPLSRNEWIKQYKVFAPRVQGLMDNMKRRLEQVWGPASLKQECFTKLSPGSDIQSFLDKFLAVQNQCERMADIAFKIRGPGNGLLFDSHYCSHSVGEKCGCVRAVKEVENDGDPVEAVTTPPDCQSLQCYLDDENVIKALDVVKKKADVCRGQVLAARAWSGDAIVVLQASGEAFGKTTPPRRRARKCAESAAFLGFRTWVSVG